MQMKHRNVVSNFLFNPTRDHASIALFRRSNKVRTYQGKLAPISGSIEDDERPFDAAVREIEEETGLRHCYGFELYLSGKPFTMSDESIGRSWTVHPFSWKLRDAAPDFRLDWEHTEYQWTAPKDIMEGRLESDSVPNLAESMKRVWLKDGAIFEEWQANDCGVETTLENALENLKNDHISGAGYMATLAVQHFQSIVAALVPHTTPSKYWSQLTLVAFHIINNGRPSMNAAIENALLSVLKRIKGCTDRSQMVAKIHMYLAERTAVHAKISGSFVSYVTQHFERRLAQANAALPAKLSILTLSASMTKSAILAVLRALPHIEIDLRILESRPLCEGALMASKMLQSIGRTEEDRLSITIATDASAAILARDVDLVLLGADRISADGDVSNKTGSFAATLCARAVGNQAPDAVTPKVVILTGTEKIAKPGRLDDHMEEDNSAWQVWRVYDDIAGCKQMSGLQNNKKVVFKNVFFEWVPAEYIDLYLTEHGAMNTTQIQTASMQMQALEAEVFDF